MTMPNKTSSFLCPKCKIHLHTLKKKEIEIDVCDKCHGMWLDDKEIDKLLKTGGKL